MSVGRSQQYRYVVYFIEHSQIKQYYMQKKENRGDIYMGGQ
ncbi:9767_t:CDS:1, partial [Gigaspora rosea]